MTTTARRPWRILAPLLVSTLVVVISLVTVTDPAEARRGGGSGGRSYHARWFGSSHHSYRSRVGRSTHGFGDNHFGATGPRFRRGPDGVPYFVGFGSAGDTMDGVEIEAAAQPACVFDRVPNPPPGYTVFSRPPRPFEVTGQPVAFSDEVPDRAGGFRLCE